jgi:hypothetical protein
MRLAVVFVALAACQTYAVHRAAFVPRAVPIPTSGQPNASAADLSLDATALDPTRPVAGDPEIGVEVPGAQARGEIDLRATSNLSFGFFHERGLASTARALHDTQPPVGGGDVAGNGVQVRYAPPLDDHWRLAIAFEATVWQVPYVEYVTCTTCDMPYTDVAHGSETVTTLAGSLVQSYHAGALTWFGGLTVRNHPVAREKDLQQIPSDGGGVDSGPGVAILDAGAELEIGGGVRASLAIAQVLDSVPVAYGPSIAVGVTIPLGAVSR